MGRGVFHKGIIAETRGGEEESKIEWPLFMNCFIAGLS